MALGLGLYATGCASWFLTPRLSGDYIRPILHGAGGGYDLSPDRQLRDGRNPHPGLYSPQRRVLFNNGKPGRRLGFRQLETIGVEVISMKNTQYSPEMQQYFDSLPGIVQETIAQSNQEMNSLEDLKRCAENMMKTL